MSDLQLYLIALGAVYIAGVILFNWWQERRLSQDAIRRFDGPADDALMEDFSIDHSRDMDLGEQPDPVAEHTVPLETKEPEFVEPALESIPEDTLLADLPQPPNVANDAPVPEKAEPQPEQPIIESQDSEEELSSEQNEDSDHRGNDLPPGMDEQIDLIGVLHLTAPRSGVELLEGLNPLPGFEKFTQWYCRDEAGSWFPLTKDIHEATFVRMACALQYADRSGAASRECIRKFQLKVEKLAEDLNADLEWRRAGDQLKYAAELDQFCIDVDVMVGFHIMHGSHGPFAATKLRGIAEAGGMKLRDDGAFHFETESGETLFTLVSYDHVPFTSDMMRTSFVRGVSFQLDVPRVRNCPDAFNQMALLARQMQNSLSGLLIDDNQQPLSAEAIEKIREQLRIIYAKMVARSVIPGSPSALRLFS